MCMYVGRSLGKEHEREENFSPAELQKNQITSTVDDVGLKEAPPIVMTSEARGYEYSLQTNQQALCPLPESLQPHLPVIFSESLQHPLEQQQHRPIYPAVSADDGSDTQLSSLEREVLRTRGQPWDAPGPRRTLRQCYTVWHIWHRMSEKRKGLIRRKLEF